MEYVFVGGGGVVWGGGRGRIYWCPGAALHPTLNRTTGATLEICVLDIPLPL